MSVPMRLRRPGCGTGVVARQTWPPLDIVVAAALLLAILAGRPLWMAGPADPGPARPGELAGEVVDDARPGFAAGVTMSASSGGAAARPIHDVASRERLRVGDRGTMLLIGLLVLLLGLGIARPAWLTSPLTRRASLGARIALPPRRGPPR